MDIILLKDVEHVGDANTIVSVKPGYARNFLIPQGFAIVANPANRNELAHQTRVQDAREAKSLEAFKATATKISSATLRIVTKAGTSGKIFGSVTNVQILAAIKEAFGEEIERKRITLNEEVKMLGTYTANVQLSKQVAATVTFDVVTDEPIVEA